MGLGGTAKKLQKVAGMAEDLYKRMNEVITELKKLRSDLEETNAQVDDLEHQLTEQRAILEAMADAEGVDVSEALADVEREAEESDTTAADEDDTPAAGEAEATPSE